MGHSRWTSRPAAAAARCSFVTNAVMVEKAVSSSASADLADLHNTWIVGSQIWKSRGVRAPVPHSWRRHCAIDNRQTDRQTDRHLLFWRQTEGNSCDIIRDSRSGRKRGQDSNHRRLNTQYRGEGGASGPLILWFKATRHNHTPV